MSTDTVFGAAVVGSDTLKCVTRDGREFEFKGPPNMPPNQHRVCMRFDLGSTWTVTFQRYDNSDRWGEVSAEKRMPGMPFDHERAARTLKS